VIGTGAHVAVIAIQSSESRRSGLSFLISYSGGVHHLGITPYALRAITSVIITWILAGLMSVRDTPTHQSSPSTPKRPSKTASSQSLNHLLNFTLPPRPSQQPQSIPRRSRKNASQHGFWNKESEWCIHFLPRQRSYNSWCRICERAI